MLRQPSEEEIEHYVRDTLSQLPEAFARELENVVVRVMEFADRETLNNMGIDDPYDLLGLYHGVSLDQKSMFDSGREPDYVFIYRQPVMDYAAYTGQSLKAVVHHVVIHELGHHFGFSDDDMHWLEESE
jgi:predicted Zn-dependent protease with MMP-like domain